MTVYFMDGQFTERDGLAISIDDRGYYFGDGVYEVIKSIWWRIIYCGRTY